MMTTTTTVDPNATSAPTTTVPPPDIYSFTIKPIVANGRAGDFINALVTNTTGLGYLEIALVADLARRLGLNPNKLTILGNPTYSAQTAELYFKISIDANVTGNTNKPINTALQESVSTGNADWLNGTLAEMKAVGAAKGIDVLGAAMPSVVGGVTTAAPSGDLNDLCFINDDCIISAVVIGVGVLVLIIAVTMLGAKACGGGPNKAEEKALERKQSNHSLERRPSQQQLQRRGSSYDMEMNKMQQQQPVLVQPQNSVPQTAPAPAVQYSGTIDDDL